METIYLKVDLKKKEDRRHITRKQARIRNRVYAMMLMICFVIGIACVAYQLVPGPTEEVTNLKVMNASLNHDDTAAYIHTTAMRTYYYSYTGEQDLGIEETTTPTAEPTATVQPTPEPTPEPTVEPTEEPTPVYIPPIEYTADEEEALFYLCENEAHGGSFFHKQVVAAVVVNRALSGRFNYWTLMEVMEAPNQFGGNRNYHQKYYPPTDETIAAVRSILSGEADLYEISQGALFFYAPKYAGGYLNSFESRTFIMEVEGNRFFK